MLCHESRVHVSRPADLYGVTYTIAMQLDMKLHINFDFFLYGGGFGLFLLVCALRCPQTDILRVLMCFGF